MAVALDATSTAPASAGASRTTMTWSHTVGASATLLTVAVTYAGGGSVTTSSVTWNGTPLTGYTRATSSGGANNRLVDLWYIVNPAPGTANIVVTQSGSNDCDAAALSWNGTSTSTPLGTATTQAAATGTTSGPLGTTGGAFVLAAAAIRSTAVPTIGGSPTVVLQRVTGAFNNESNAITYQAVTYSPSWSWATGTDENAAFAVPINAPSSTAAGLPTSTVVEVEFTAGAWTDVSTWVQGDSLSINVGRDSAAGDIQPGTLDLTVDNYDGTWTPGNPSSTYYPNLIEGKRIRVRVTKGTTSTRFVGRLTAIVPDFPEVAPLATTALSAVDVLGEMTRMTALPPMPQLVAEAACRSATGAYWPMTDTASDGVFAVSFSSGSIGTPSFVPWLATSTGVVNYAADSSAPAGGDPCVSLTAGAAVVAFDPTISFTTLGGWFFLQQGPAGMVMQLDVAKPSSLVSPPAASYGSFAKWDGAGTVSFYYGPTLVGSVAAAPGWHWIHLQGAGLSSAGGFCDTTFVNFGAAVPFTPLPSVATIGGAIPLSVRDLASVTYTAALPRTMLSGTQTSTDVLADTASVLTSRGLTATLAWSSATSPAAQLAADPVTAGKDALTVLQTIANNQSGVAYQTYSTSATQTVTLLAEADYRPITPAITVDVDADAAGGPAVARDVYAKLASATASGPVNNVTVTDSTASSDGASVSVDAALRAQNHLRAIATDRLAQSKYGKLRIAQITIDLATAANDLYAAFFALTPGKRLRLTNIPSGYFGVTYMDGYVLGWTERPGVDGYQVTFNLAAADAPPEGRFDDSTYGRFAAGGTMTLTTGITSSGTSVSITTSSGPTLTTTAGSYPLSITIDGEAMTIASAPAGAASPQTVTVTRGLAPTIAVAHSAGAPIEIYNAASFAL